MSFRVKGREEIGRFLKEEKREGQRCIDIRERTGL